MLLRVAQRLYSLASYRPSILTSLNLKGDSSLPDHIHKAMHQWQATHFNTIVTVCWDQKVIYTLVQASKLQLVNINLPYMYFSVIWLLTTWLGCRFVNLNSEPSQHCKLLWSTYWRPLQTWTLVFCSPFQQIACMWAWWCIIFDLRWLILLYIAFTRKLLLY